ncbi:MAG: Ig-like domain-containing protein [Candidatus Hydrothermales bacterium]
MRKILILLILIYFFTFCKRKDEEPPRVWIISPVENESFFPDTIEIKVKAEDNEGIDYIEVFVDGTSVGKKESSYGVFLWDGSTSKDSSIHVVYAKALDFAGNVGRSRDVKFIIYSANHPPKIKLIKPDSGALLNSYKVNLIYSGKDKDIFDTLLYNVHIDTFPYPIYKEPIVRNYRDTIFTIENLNPNKRYYWQVVVSDILGLKDTSSVYFFLTPPLNRKPLPPTDPLPPDGSIDVDYTPRLSYYSFDPDGDSIYFRIKFDTSRFFINPLLNILTRDTFYRITDSLTPGLKYFWQVAVYDTKGDSAVGNIWKFTVKKNRLALVNSIEGFWYKDIEGFYDTIFALKAPNRLEIYLENLGNLNFLKSFDLPNFSYRVYYKKPYIFVLYGNVGPRKLGLYKKENLNIFFLDEFSLSSGSIKEVLFYESYIYVITLYGFKILKIISDTFAVINSKTTSFQVSDGDIGCNNLYLIGDYYLEAFSLNSPENPYSLFKKNTSFPGLTNIKIHGRYILINTNYYLLLYYISDPNLEPLLNHFLSHTENIKIIKNFKKIFGLFNFNSTNLVYTNTEGIHIYTEIFYLSGIESGFIRLPYLFIASQNGLHVLLCQK